MFPSIALLHTISPMSFASSAVGAVARGCENWRAAETSLDASTAVECCASDSNKDGISCDIDAQVWNYDPIIRR